MTYLALEPAPVLAPRGTIMVEFRHDIAIRLFPEEEDHIRSAGPSRRREFTTARWCAREALRQLGVTPGPLVPGNGGLPAWPPGTIGSLTHCIGYRAAVATTATYYRATGIDALPHTGPLCDSVLARISTVKERDRLRILEHDAPVVVWSRVLFSAKESVFKCWFPQTRTSLDMSAIDVRIDPDGRFRIGFLIVPARHRDVAEVIEATTGSWEVRDDTIVTTLWIPS